MIDGTDGTMQDSRTLSHVEERHFTENLDLILTLMIIFFFPIKDEENMSVGMPFNDV